MADMKKFVELSGPHMAVIDAFLLSEGLDDKSIIVIFNSIIELSMIL